MERKKAHADKIPHFGVSIYAINDKGEFLVQRRAPSRSSNPNMWTDSASGHIQYIPKITYSYFYESAVREFTEETGIEHIHHITFNDLETIYIDGDDIEILFNFTAVVKGKPVFDLEECSPDSGYMSKNELMQLLETKPFTPHAKVGWRKYMDELLAFK